MFEVQGSVRASDEADELRLVDHDRDVWLRWIGTYAGSPVTSFQLHTLDRVFLLESLREAQSDGNYRSRIVNLGFSPVGTLHMGIQSDQFQSPEDRKAVGLLAAEALLVFGSFYRGNSDPSLNRETIEFDGVEYSLADLMGSSAHGGESADAPGLG